MANKMRIDATVAPAGSARTKEHGHEHAHDVPPAGPPDSNNKGKEQGSSPASVTSTAPTHLAAPTAPVRKAGICVTWEPCEAGGLAMTEFVEAMRADAEAQEQLVPVLGRVLDGTIKANAAASTSRPSARGRALPHFESTSPCPLLPSAYLARMLRYTAVSPCNLLIGIMYLQRLKDRQDTILLTAHNCQRLLLCSSMLASKTFDDKYVSNKQWAAVGDLTTKELNALELELLVALQFDLNVHRDDYNASCRMLYHALGSMQHDAEPDLKASPRAISIQASSASSSSSSGAATPRQVPAKTPAPTSGRAQRSCAMAGMASSPGGPISATSTPEVTPAASPMKQAHHRSVEEDGKQSGAGASGVGNTNSHSKTASPTRPTRAGVLKTAHAEAESAVAVDAFLSCGYSVAGGDALK